MGSRSLLALALVSLLGCASRNQFQRVDGPVASAPFEDSKGKAKVVVLSPAVHGESMMFAWAITHPIQVNGVALGAIQANDYVQCLVDPGDVTVWTKGQNVSELTFPATANRIYFVSAWPRPGRYRANVDLQIAPPGDAARLMQAGTDKTRPEAVRGQ